MIYRRNEDPGIFSGGYSSVEQGEGMNTVDPETGTTPNTSPDDVSWQPLPFNRWMSEQLGAAPIGPQGEDYWWEMYLDYVNSGGRQFSVGG
jgi:hypothetical protein